MALNWEAVAVVTGLSTFFILIDLLNNSRSEFSRSSPSSNRRRHRLPQSVSPKARNSTHVAPPGVEKPRPPVPRTKAMMKKPRTEDPRKDANDADADDSHPTNTEPHSPHTPPPATTPIGTEVKVRFEAAPILTLTLPEPSSSDHELLSFDGSVEEDEYQVLSGLSLMATPPHPVKDHSNARLPTEDMTSVRPRGHRSHGNGVHGYNGGRISTINTAINDDDDDDAGEQHRQSTGTSNAHGFRFEPETPTDRARSGRENSPGAGVQIITGSTESRVGAAQAQSDITIPAPGRNHVGAPIPSPIGPSSPDHRSPNPPPRGASHEVVSRVTMVVVWWVYMVVDCVLKVLAMLVLLYLIAQWFRVGPDQHQVTVGKQSWLGQLLTPLTRKDWSKKD